MYSKIQNHFSNAKTKQTGTTPLLDTPISFSWELDYDLKILAGEQYNKLYFNVEIWLLSLNGRHVKWFVYVFCGNFEIDRLFNRINLIEWSPWNKHTISDESSVVLENSENILIIDDKTWFDEHWTLEKDQHCRY